MNEDLQGANLGCIYPPEGWYCTREPGHDGPCAAIRMGDNSAAAITMDDMRKAFEAWNGPFNLGRNNSPESDLDDYENGTTSYAWKAWQDGMKWFNAMK